MRHLDLVTSKISCFGSYIEGFYSIKNKFDSSEKPVIVSFVNAHACNIAKKNKSFLRNIIDSDFVLRDGVGIKILLRSKKIDPGENLNGTDFIPFFIENYLKIKTRPKILLLGSTEKNNSKAVINLSKKNVEIIGIHGFLDHQTYISKINEFKPEIIVLGLGMPLQEILSHKILKEVDFNSIIFNGGAIIDFISEEVPRAPIIFRKTGTEWIFRLLREPKRLFKRYIIGNANFLYDVIINRVNTTN